MHQKSIKTVISGAARGIGKTLGLGFSKAGHEVILLDKDAHHGKLVMESIHKQNGSGIFFHCDISQADQIAATFARIRKQYGYIHSLINNAGIGIWKDPLELTTEEWDSVINTNLRGAFLCSREAARIMDHDSAIINIASTRAIMSEPNSEAYAASKGGLLALTHALSASLASRGIRVNCISPGWIETKNYHQLTDLDHSQHFTGRVGKAEDILEACLYLVSAKAGFITGTNLVIDGGMTKKMIYCE